MSIAALVEEVQAETGLSRSAAEELVERSIRLARKKQTIQKRLDNRRNTNYLDFLREASPEMEWENAFTLYISDIIDQIVSGALLNVVISLPPRTGKSEILTKRLPVYWLERRPRDKVIIGAYNHTLARTFTSSALKIYKERNPNDMDMEAEDEWSNAYGGSVRAVGVGSGVTGHGGNCFPSGTAIKTVVGDTDIRTLYLLQSKPLVYAFDHATGQIVPKKIVAVREIESDDVYEITTTSGRTVRATGDHHFYAVQQGYKAAKLLSRGDRLLIAKENMPVVREEEGPREQDLCNLLVRDEDAQGNSGVRVLPQDIRAECLREGEGAEARKYGRILHIEMCQGSPCDKELYGPLQKLRNCHSDKSRREVLQRYLQGDCRQREDEDSQGKESKDLRILRGEVQPNLFSADVLQSGMRGSISFDLNEGGGKFSLQGRDELREVVRLHAPVNSGARQVQVRDLPERGREDTCRLERANGLSFKLGYPSYRRESKQQQGDELDNALQQVSHEAPQVKEESVEMVRRVRTGRIAVYDLQVEDCHNFFAEDILVHNCIIIDDPVKSIQEAFSKAYRDRVWNWYISDLRTRRNDLARTPTIVIATRWSRDDLIGRILQEADPGEWLEIRIPAIAREDDPLGREVGESINPVRLPIAALEREKRLMGPRFDSLYQQDPIDEEGGMFDVDKIERVQGVPIEAHRVRFWDRAASAGAGDWTVGVLMAYDKDGLIYIEDVIRERLAKDGVRKRMKDTLMDDLMRYGNNQIWNFKTYFEREPAGDGKTAAEDIVRDMAPYPIYWDRSSDNKTARSAGFSVAVNAGNVRIKLAPWNREFLDELARFVGGIDNKQDDQCFVAGTMITTIKGDVPIESIKIGDLVLTRDGYRPVDACGMTNPSARIVTAYLSNTRKLIGTPNHRVFTRDGEIWPLESLAGRDLFSLPKYPGEFGPCAIGVIDDDERAAVYNLSVSEIHEYFANGVLVSNCDAASGAYNKLVIDNAVVTVR